MRLAMLAAMAGIVGLDEPALALDKVKFGTNWLADPEAGGFYQALADGTYEKYGLDVAIIPGGPQTNGALMLLFGKIEFFMGGDQNRRLPQRRKQTADRGRRRLPKIAANFHVAPGRRARQMGGSAACETRLCRRGRNQHVLWLAEARLRIQGRSNQAVQFQFGAIHSQHDVNPAGLCDRRAIRN